MSVSFSSNNYTFLLINLLIRKRFLISSCIILSIIGFFMIPYLEKYQKQLQKQNYVKRNKK
jgi:predicted membrane protein